MRGEDIFTLVAGAVVALLIAAATIGNESRSETLARQRTETIEVCVTYIDSYQARRRYRIQPGEGFWVTQSRSGFRLVSRVTGGKMFFFPVSYSVLLEHGVMRAERC